jgi:uncharacterized protein YqgV (UPF0045/DUF77 family)
MQTTVEITLYPNQAEFIPPIKAFIERLNHYTDFQIQTFPTATIVCGEHNAVMDMLKTESQIQREQFGMGPLVVKILAGYEALPSV